MDAASLQEQQQEQEQEQEQDKEQDPAANRDDDDDDHHHHQQEEEEQEEHHHHRTSLSSSLELPVPAIARVIAIRQSSDRTLPPLPSRGASSASVSVSVSDPPPPPQQQQQQQSGFSLEKSPGPKTGIVRSKRPPPLDIDQARPGRSASGIGRRVRRMTSSVLGKALPPVVLNDGEPKDTAATAATAPMPTYARKNRKRVLGLPWWAFALILFALIVVIIVCVVVPTQISAKRKANRASGGSASTTSSTLPHYPFSPSTTTSSTASSSSPSASDVSTAICRKILPCENDGVSSVRNLTCVCICTNDFAGNVCQYASGTACSVYTLANSDADRKNVTLGTSIAEVLDGDDEFFAYISLNASAIYDVFTDADVGCSSQNALVSFDTDDTTSSTFNITSSVLDFAQILVLDVLQTNKSVSDAAMLQESLQTAFDDDEIDADTGTVYLEYCGVEVDFLTFTATGNGVGGG